MVKFISPSLCRTYFGISQAKVHTGNICHFLRGILKQVRDDLLFLRRIVIMHQKQPCELLLVNCISLLKVSPYGRDLEGAYFSETNLLKSVNRMSFFSKVITPLIKSNTLNAFTSSNILLAFSLFCRYCTVY